MQREREAKDPAKVRAGQARQRQLREQLAEQALVAETLEAFRIHSSRRVSPAAFLSAWLALITV